MHEFPLSPILRPYAFSPSKESTCNGGDVVNAVLILGLRSSGAGNGNPLQSSRLGSPTDRGAFGATVHGVIKIQTRLSG